MFFSFILALLCVSVNCCPITISANPNVSSTNLQSFLNTQSCTPANLDSLTISQTQLGDLLSATFAGLVHLTAIYINNCNVTSIPVNSFAGLSALTYLSLSHNLLSSLPTNTFLGMNSNNGTPLSVDLSNNRLTTLQSGLFSSCNSLQFVNASGNQLSSLEASVFSGVPVEQIDLSYNKLSQIVSGSFSGLTSLKSLYLNNNQLSSVNSNLGGDSILLQYVNIKSNTALVTLPLGAFGVGVQHLTVDMDSPPKCSSSLGGCTSCRATQTDCYYAFNTPTPSPTTAPSRAPTQPTRPPTSSPTTQVPSQKPTSLPSQYPSRPPTSAQPTYAPTIFPTNLPTTSIPTAQPIASPPTTLVPTSPSTSFPTGAPTLTSPPSSPTTTSPSTLSPTAASHTKTPTSSLPPSVPSSPLSTLSPTTSLPSQLLVTYSPTRAPIEFTPSAKPTTTGQPPTSLGQPSASFPGNHTPTAFPSSKPSSRPTSQSAPTPALAAQNQGSDTSNDSNNSDLSISVGVPVAIVFLIVGLILFCLCYRRKLTIDGRILVQLQHENVVGPGGSRPGSVEFRDLSAKQGQVGLSVSIPTNYDDASLSVGTPSIDPPHYTNPADPSIRRPLPAPASPATRPPVMTEIPSYEVEVGAQLGHGAFGSVHQCLWRGTDYALKRLLNPDQGALFEKEVEVNRQLACLPHIYVTRMVGFISNPTAGIVMELYPGNVEDFLRTNLLGKDDFAQLLTVLINASAGVMHLHSLGIIHRDLAARNFLIKQDLSAAVCDFGLAMPLPEGKSKGQRTPAERQTDMLPVNVAAPETLEEGIYSTASDVYMFGLFIWEVLARQTPHSDRPEFTLEHKDFKGFIHKVIHEDLRPVLPLEWPSGLRMLLAQCWHRNPGSRPTMMHVNDTLRLCRKEILENHIFLPHSLVQRLIADPHVYYSPVVEKSALSHDEVVPPSDASVLGDGQSLHALNDHGELIHRLKARIHNHPYSRPLKVLEPTQNLYNQSGFVNPN